MAPFLMGDCNRWLSSVCWRESLPFWKSKRCLAFACLARLLTHQNAALLPKTSHIWMHYSVELSRYVQRVQRTFHPHSICNGPYLETCAQYNSLCHRYMPFNQPPPPPPRTRPPSASDPSGPRYMPTPPEYPGRQQGQHVGGPAVHGHGQGQYEGHGPLQSFGAASMGGTGYQPPHLRNRDRVRPQYQLSSVYLLNGRRTHGCDAGS